MIAALRAAAAAATGRARLRAAALAVLVTLAGCGHSAPLGPQPATGAERLRVVVVVVDSLMPHEVTPALTPRLAALKAAGTFYEESRAIFIAETIPNHVAMMTGVYPDRNGIFSNDYLDFTVTPPEEFDLSAPEKLTANTLFTWIDRQCRVSGVAPQIRTAATLSKKYLFEVFAGDAANPALPNESPNVFNVQPDSYWNPQDSPSYVPSPSEHTPDTPTMDQALTQLAEDDPDFFFINLGDVDRLAHASGADVRSAALAEADAQVGRLVDELVALGRWPHTVLFVVSDHGMDYSAPGPFDVISTQAALDNLAACTLPMQAIVSGEGTESIYVLDRTAPQAERQTAQRAARACLLGTQDCAALCPGAYAPINWSNIETAWYREDDFLDAAGNMPLSLRAAHPSSGDLVLTAAMGAKFGEPDPSSPSAQIPGNHGHPATFRNTFLIAGGSPWVKPAQSIAPSVASPVPLDRLPEQSETIDVAPTVAWLMGLRIEPEGFPDFPARTQGFDGRILKEAFVQFDADANAPSPSDCGRFD